MIAFALSHILYLAAYAIAFSRLFPGQSPVAWYEILILILVLAAAALLMKPLQVGAGKLKIPMALYTAILAAMVIHACYLAISCVRAGSHCAFPSCFYWGAGRCCSPFQTGRWRFSILRIVKNIRCAA